MCILQFSGDKRIDNCTTRHAAFFRDGTTPSFSINVKYNAHSSTYRYIVDEAETRTRRSNERRIPRKKKQKHLFSPPRMFHLLHFTRSPTLWWVTKLPPRASSRFVVRAISHPDSPINFVEFIERHGTALDSLPYRHWSPHARVPVLINMLIVIPPNKYA